MTIPAGWQIRAARSALNWPRKYLAHVSGHAISSIEEAERGFRTGHRCHISNDCKQSIARTLERHGIEFVDDGIKFKRKMEDRYGNTRER